MPVVLICYVDDVSLATPKESAYKTIYSLLEKHVKIHETGRIPMSGGTLKFLGRTFMRARGSAALFVSVNPDYMDECFHEFGIEKGTTTFPDIRAAIEETIDHAPISAKARAKYRRSLAMKRLFECASGTFTRT